MQAAIGVAPKGPEGPGLQVQDPRRLGIKQKPVAGGAGHGGTQDHPVKVGQLGARGQVVVFHAGSVPRFGASAPAAAHVRGWRSPLGRVHRASRSAVVGHQGQA